ncbi:hypothetical protein JCM3774_003380 [Rhodotorula dairenensis]
MNPVESLASNSGADSPPKDETPVAKLSDSLATPYPYSPVSPPDTVLDVQVDYGTAPLEDGTVSMQGKLSLAPSPSPGSRAHSPSLLLWSEPGWSLGTFVFTPYTTSGGGGESASSGPPSIESSQNLAPSERKSSLGSSDLNESKPEHEHDREQEQHLPVNPDKLVRDLCDTPSIEPKSARPSKLVPTAVPFASKAPAAAADASAAPATTPAESRTRPRPFPIDVHIRARQRKGSAAPVVADSFSPTSSPLEPCTPPPFAHVGPAQFDAEGHLVSHGAKYNIADEILQLQTGPLSPSFGQDTRHRSFDSYLGDDTFRQRELNQQAINAANDSAHWYGELEAEPSGFGTYGLGCQAVPFPSLASLATGATERGRSMSLASSSSLASPFRQSRERSNTVAQLQSYFGPPTADLNVPLGAPAPLDAYAASGLGRSYGSSLASSQALSRTTSYASLSGGGGLASPYPPLAHPEPFNLTPEDPLYIEARDIFVDSSCSSLAATPTSQHRQTMAAHFDRAMHTLTPLASLYGLSQDAANHLLADPANSGVSEVVLKVAAMRGRQQQMASVQRSAMGMPLPGPSPNNRKLNLYKTELCRSWEEKGSCRYGVKCQFAHGIHELREVARHPKFKSEICRTFWTQGSCPYGKRCCFIHAVPDASSPNASPPKLSAPNTRPTTPSRTQARMTSTAITGAPSRTFGPALSELIGTPRSPGSVQNSPTQKKRADSNASSHSFGAASLETSALFGLGLRERPGQAPPTYKEAPQSRLQRLANLSAGPSSTSLSSLGSANGTTTACGGAAGESGIPHARHDSAHSFFSSSSVSSAAASSPLLTRSGSTSSLSSTGGSPVLHRISKDWLTSPTYASSNTAHHLDWPAVEELSLEDPPHSAGAMLSQHFPHYA